MAGKYADLTRDELVKLLEARDRRKKLGLVWEREDIAADRRRNADFVVCELDTGLSDMTAPWDNIVIEADNFDALRWLRMTHRGGVKCIYIDPPYNTGNKDWVYNDRYVSKEDAYRHSTWLEFLFQRLEIARDLLAEDGVMLVSINDENRAKLELLLDEVMPGMRLGSMVWRTRVGSNADHGFFMSQDHEHVLVFGREAFRFIGNEKTYALYGNPDGDERGDWTKSDLTLGFSYIERPNLFYPLVDPSSGIAYPPNPDRVWVYPSKERSSTSRTQFMEDRLADKQIAFPTEQRVEVWDTTEALLDAIDRNDVPTSGRTPLLRRGLPGLEYWVGRRVGFGTPRLKRFKANLRNQRQPLSSWVTPRAEAEDTDAQIVQLVSGTNDEAAKEVKSIFGEKAFNYAKPVSLIRELVRQSTGPTDLVLDFFAGSATTAQAVMELNAEDNGSRRFIMVSSTEATEADPARNICRDVTAERIRRLNASDDPKYADLRASFAYLRTRTVRFEDLDYELEPDHIWIALQALHKLPLTEYDPSAPWQTHETDDLTLVFVTRFPPEFLDWVTARGNRNMIIYSDAPGVLANELGERNIEILPAQDTLVQRFRT